MSDHLEVWGAGGPRLVALDGPQVTIGNAAANDIALTQDRSVSRLHAVLERYGAGWCVRSGVTKRHVRQRRADVD